MILSVSAVCAYAAPASYCPIDRSESESAETQALRSRIEQLQNSLAAEDAKLVHEFYEPCGYALAWTADDGVTPVSAAAIEVLQSTATRGLNPGDYPIPVTPSTRTVQPSSLKEFERWEITLTIATMRLARDLRCGRVDPREIHADLPVPCSDFNTAEFLWHAVQDGNLARAFDSLEPTAPGYLRTKEAFSRLIVLAREPQIVLPPLKKPLKPQDRWAGIAAMTVLLARTGDLHDSSSTTPSARYDETLIRATESYQARHRLPPDGTLSLETYRELAIPIADRITQLSLTLERWRWIQRSFSQPPIVVNIPEFRLRAYNNDLHVSLAMSVIVGRAYRRHTPVFQNQISAVIFRPFWNVPAGIQRNEIAPAMRRDPNYLKKHNYEFVSMPGGEFRIRQRPGENNALGLVKFSLPNVHDVYLHSTPEQKLFQRTRRDFSHGCIRVEDPVSLAAWVLKSNPGWTRERIESAMNGDHTFSVPLKTPLPVLIVYGTGFAAEDGLVYFLPDIYGEDRALSRAIQKVSQKRADNDRTDIHASQ